MLEEAAIINELSQIQDRLDAMKKAHNKELQLLILMFVNVVLLVLCLYSKVVDGVSRCR